MKKFILRPSNNEKIKMKINKVSQNPVYYFIWIDAFIICTRYINQLNNNLSNRLIISQNKGPSSRRDRLSRIYLFSK